MKHLKHAGNDPLVKVGIDHHWRIVDALVRWAIRTTHTRRYTFFCLIVCVLWAPLFLVQDFSTWQLEINTATTIVTFLMVALLGPSESESQRAIHEKLDALSRGLVVVLTEIESDPGEAS